MTAPTPQSEVPAGPPPQPVPAAPTATGPMGAGPPAPPPQQPAGRWGGLAPIPDGVVMFGALLVVGFSFAPFVEYDPGTRSARTASAWEWAPFLAPLTWFIIVGGLVLMALGLNHALAGDRRVLGFRTGQLQVVVAAYTASLLVGYALVEKDQAGSVSVNLPLVQVQGGLTITGAFAWGGVLMVVGALIALVGALLNVLPLPMFQDRRG